MNSKRNISLFTKRLEIRPYTLQDYQSWKEGYLGRLQSQNEFDFGPPKGANFSLAEFRKMLKRWKKLSEEDKVYVFGVFLKKNRKHVGAIDIATLERENVQKANLGYRIHNQFWKNGYGAESARAALTIGFKYLQFHRIEAAIDPKNRASLRTARAIGMEKESLRKKYFLESGKWVDNVFYVATPETIGLSSKCEISFYETL